MIHRKADSYISECFDGKTTTTTAKPVSCLPLFAFIALKIQELFRKEEKKEKEKGLLQK